MHAEWEAFYLIVGGAAGALIGLQFVVMTLFADRQKTPGVEVGAAFSTPTVVYFSAALLISALTMVPWPDLRLAGFAWGAVGLAGVIYALSIIGYIRRQSAYQPVAEDWWFDVILPVVAFATLTASGGLAIAHFEPTLFGVAASALLLLFIGIHNAWDAISFDVFVIRGGAAEDN